MATLSIVIPAYNEERFIGTLLDKIRAVDLQSLGIEKQIIVVDDCSSDRTAEIAGNAPGVEELTRDRRARLDLGAGLRTRPAVECARVQRCARMPGTGPAAAVPPSDVEIAHAERVRLDERASRLDLFSHQRREDFFR